LSQSQELSFTRDIKPLFRDVDREAMESTFDLWDLEDVRASAEAILAVVEAGIMPCDEAWPAERVQLFKSWTQAGMPA
jgi:hypothetical protein